MTDLLLDAVVETRLAWFFLHDSDDRFGVLPDDGGVVGQAVETADGVCILLGDEDGSDEVRVRVRVVRDVGGSGDASGDLVFDQSLFLYGAGMVVEDGFPSTPHLLELGGPGRVNVGLFLDLTARPAAVTVVLGELVPDRSVLPPVPLRERVGRWLRGRR